MVPIPKSSHKIYVTSRSEYGLRRVVPEYLYTKTQLQKYGDDRAKDSEKWKEYTKHLSICGDCAESLEDCTIGKEIKEALNDH